MTIVLKKRHEKLEKLMQRKAKIESELSRLEKTQKAENRKLDSRRKIVLGSALLKAMSEGKIQGDFARNLIERFASDRDKVIFVDFEFPSAEKRGVDGVVNASGE